MSINNFFTGGHAIYRAVQTVDSSGAPVTAWMFHLDVTGKLWQLSGDETLSADKKTMFADHKFATALNDIVETDRYYDPDGNKYEIKTVARRLRPAGSGHLELSLELIR